MCLKNCDSGSTLRFMYNKIGMVFYKLKYNGMILRISCDKNFIKTLNIHSLI